MFGGARKRRKFDYTARRGDETRVEGSVEAEDAAAAANQVMDRGLHPEKISGGKRIRDQVLVCDGVRDGLVARWRFGQEDGEVAVWKPSRSGRVFGAAIAAFSLAVLVGVWRFLPGVQGGESQSWMVVGFEALWGTGKVLITVVCSLFFILGLLGIFQKGELRVDRRGGRLEFRRFGWKGFVCEEIREIVVERRYHSFPDCGDDTSHLSPVPTVRAMCEDGTMEELEQCHSEKHALEFGTKVADYLNVPCRNTLRGEGMRDA